MVASPCLHDFDDIDRVTEQSALILGAAKLVIAGNAIYVHKIARRMPERS